MESMGESTFTSQFFKTGPSGVEKWILPIKNGIVLVRQIESKCYMQLCPIDLVTLNISHFCTTRPTTIAPPACCIFSKLEPIPANLTLRGSLPCIGVPTPDTLRLFK